MMFKNNARKEKGVALYLTIIVMALLLTMVFGLGTSFINQSKLLSEVGRSLVVLYAAEAGLEAVLFQDLQNADVTTCDGGGSVPAFCKGTLSSGASYAVVVEVPGPGSDCTAQAFCVESKGSFGPSARALRMIVDSVGFGCIEKLDVMLVLDRSGSINPTAFGQLKTAAKAFVDVLAPSLDTAHIGQVSFGDQAGGQYPTSLDQVLTDSSSLLYAKIDPYLDSVHTPSTDTYMAPAFTFAKDELASVRDRDDSVSPDFVVFITDGNPDDSKASVIAAADAVKAAGIEIFVVGVGLGGAAQKQAAESFLRDDIASTPTNYFYIDNYGALEAKLEELATCG